MRLALRTVLYCTVLYCTVLYCTVQDRTCKYFAWPKSFSKVEGNSTAQNVL